MLNNIDIQKIIPHKLDVDIHGSKDFFEWFKTVNLNLFGKSYFTPLQSIYFKLPYSISYNLKKIYDYIWPTRYKIYQPYPIQGK